MVRGLVMIAVASVITSPWFMRSAVGGRPACASPGHRHKKSAVRPPPRGLGSWPTTPTGASGTVAVLRISVRASSTASVRLSRPGPCLGYPTACRPPLSSGCVGSAGPMCRQAMPPRAILGRYLALFCSVSTRRGERTRPSCSVVGRSVSSAHDTRPVYPPNAGSQALACCRSAVSKPSVNQRGPYWIPGSYAHMDVCNAQRIYQALET